jgi:hypothetical protein
MAIPLYACQAHGGKIVQVDDPGVSRDLAALDGAGGLVYRCFVFSARFKGAALAGYGKFRRLVQRVYLRSGCVVTLTPWRDGQETALAVSRVLAIDHPSLVIFPTSVLATEFQVRLEVSVFDAPVALGSGEVWIVPQRKAAAT